MDYQTQKIKELLALIEQHPKLPVVPMVASEIVCDDSCARWKGSWGAAEVTKYICGEEHIFFFDDSDMGEVENMALLTQAPAKAEAAPLLIRPTTIPRPASRPATCRTRSILYSVPPFPGLP